MDAAENKWFIKFAHQSGGSETIKMTYLVTTPADCEQVPDRGQACLDAHIAKHVFLVYCLYFLSFHKH